MLLQLLRILDRSRIESRVVLLKSNRRQDEIGTPFCVTVDFDSLEDGQVTVRDRDTMAQDRIPIDNVGTYLFERLG